MYNFFRFYNLYSIIVVILDPFSYLWGRFSMEHVAKINKISRLCKKINKKNHL
nr:MAG TPA: hypothetical protein [Caudoviricetes sp.]